MPPKPSRPAPRPYNVVYERLGGWREAYYLVGARFLLMSQILK